MPGVNAGGGSRGLAGCPRDVLWFLLGIRSLVRLQVPSRELKCVAEETDEVSV